MSAPRLLSLLSAVACVASANGAGAVEPQMSPSRSGDLCAVLLAESTVAIREAKAALFSRDQKEPFEQAFDAELARTFLPERMCAEGTDGAWAIVFGKSQRIDVPDDPLGTHSVLPWRLVHVDARGARAERRGTNPFTAVSGLPFTLRGDAATLRYGEIIAPRLVVGDFDGTGREQAIVMVEWPRDPTAQPDPEYDEQTFHWPHERVLGAAYILRSGRIERRKGLADSWITSVRRVEPTGAWELKTYGPFFEFLPSTRFDISEAGYPVFGPEFTVFRGEPDGLTLDDPRQLPLLRAQCEQAAARCDELLAVEDVAIFDSVCERVPTAALVRANKTCAHRIAGARRGRPASWFERFRRIPVPGVPRAPKPRR
jgi:hypothetical protein